MKHKVSKLWDKDYYQFLQLTAAGLNFTISIPCDRHLLQKKWAWKATGSRWYIELGESRPCYFSSLKGETVQSRLRVRLHLYVVK